MKGGLFHLVTLAGLSRDVVEGRYLPPSLQTEGFVHCARGQDVTLAVAGAYYAAAEGHVLVLRLDEDALTAEVRDEAPAPPDGQAHAHHQLAETFPHVYGAIETAAITGVGILGRDETGFRWPETFSSLAAFWHFNDRYNSDA